MYGSQSSSINTSRYNIFCSKRGEMDSSQLPPCKDCLQQHMKRVNYQAAVWKRALIAQPNIPNPTEHGWILVNGVLEAKWMTDSPAPTSVLEMIKCSCSKSCKLSECQCMKNGLKCTDLCKLSNCANWKTESRNPIIIMWKITQTRKVMN